MRNEICLVRPLVFIYCVVGVKAIVDKVERFSAGYFLPFKKTKFYCVT